MSTWIEIWMLWVRAGVTADLGNDLGGHLATTR